MSDDAEADAADAVEAEDVEEGEDDAVEPEASETESESESEESAPTESPESGEGLEEGDFVELSYTMRTVEDGTLVDTTDEEVAEEADIDTEEQEFGPRTIVIGSGHVFDAVEEDLLGKTVGDTGSVTVSAVDAFGEYDPEQVRTISSDKIPEDDRYPGAHVNVDGEHGHIDTIIGGRARVDFNHPLAGEDIEYEYEIVDIVEDRLEQAQGLLSMYVDLDLDLEIDTEAEEEPVYDDEGEEDGTETVEYETLYIEAVPQLTMNQQWMFSKQQIAQDVMERIGVDRVVVREVLDGGGMLGGMGGMMGGDVGADDLEDAIDDADLDDVDADEIVEELETDEE